MKAIAFAGKPAINAADYERNILACAAYLAEDADHVTLTDIIAHCSLIASEADIDVTLVHFDLLKALEALEDA